MQVTGLVHKIEERPAKGDYPAKTVLILADSAGPSLSDLSEETFIEIELQGDGKSLKKGDVVSFWGRFSWGRGSTMGFVVRNKYKVNGK